MFKLSIVLSLIVLVGFINAQTTPSTCYFNHAFLSFDLGGFANQSFTYDYTAQSEVFNFNICGPNAYCSQKLGYDVSACQETSTDIINIGEPQSGVFSPLPTSSTVGVVLTVNSEGTRCQTNVPYTTIFYLVCDRDSPDTVYSAKVIENCTIKLFLKGKSACPY
ncbi:hypothetical protein CYY_001769 [Polysphondylium violaceum]|uniref:MRH domain-containing protein n=1 Tax=Polysphondylium violaceum TaxID=133409 RepID=A0A8J4Q8S9_9MYCE|nr:hypothetical protein CYY_001769 [Polysphondylium violaceum]